MGQAHELRVQSSTIGFARWRQVDRKARIATSKKPPPEEGVDNAGPWLHHRAVGPDAGSDHSRGHELIVKPIRTPAMSTATAGQL